MFSQVAVNHSVHAGDGYLWSPCPLRGWGIFTVRKRSLRRLCFYTCLSVHRGGLQAHTQGGGWGSGRGVSRPIPRLEVWGGLTGGGLQAHTQGRLGAGGVSRPRPGGVSQHALRQTSPPSRRLLLRMVCILLECILVSNVTRIKQLVLIFLRSDLCNKIQIIEKFLHVTGASMF